MRSMINSILDQDLYKLSMQQAVCALYPHAEVEYSFINRGSTSFPDGFAKSLQQLVNKMSELYLEDKEKKFLLEECSYLTPVYVDFLSGYRFNPDEVEIYQNEVNHLVVNIRGPWYRTILWEVPLMAMISELYYLVTNQKPQPLNALRERNKRKAQKLLSMNVKFADFGTRRRFSHANHCNVIDNMKRSAGDSFVGTSNLYMAMYNGLKPIGTQAHEWFQFHAAKYGFGSANAVALEKWVDVYQGDLGIALSDTFTSDVFYRAFDMKYAKLFDGTRHDSGDPIEFANKTIAHYKKLGIDPLSKTIVFSDGLNVDTVEEIHEYCKGKIKDSYGIGTNLTNDVGVTPLNIVIKMTKAKPKDSDWIHTIKLSDSPGKWTGNEDMIGRCREELGIKD